MVAAIGSGGGLGALARCGEDAVVVWVLGAAFAVGLLSINISGAFLMGLGAGQVAYL